MNHSSTVATWVLGLWTTWDWAKSSLYSYVLWGIQPYWRQWEGMWTITSKLQRSQMEFEKQKPVGGTRSREAFKRAGKSADFPGSKAMRRIKPLQRKKKKTQTCLRFHHRNVEGDICPGFSPKKDAEEIIKLKISVAQWICLGVRRKFRNGESAAGEVCFLAVEMLKPSKSMCWRVSENCRAEAISKPQNVG